MKKIHIIGTGGLSKELISYIDNEIDSRYQILGAWSNEPFNNKKYKKYHKGNIEDFKRRYLQDEMVIIAIANNVVRKRIVESDLKNIKINYLTYIHPTSLVSKEASIGEGCILAPGCIVCADAKIDNFNFFNTHCTIGHDVSIGTYNCFFPKVEICGSSKVSTNTVFGINSIVLPEVEIHANSKIDAMSVIRRSTKEQGLYSGNPARLIKSFEKNDT